LAGRAVRKTDRDGCVLQRSHGPAILERSWAYLRFAACRLRRHQKQLYSRKVRGIRSSDMESYLKESAFAFPLNGDWERACLSNSNRPAVYRQPSTGKCQNPLHYVVVTGIDWRMVPFSQRSRAWETPRVAREDFEKQWRPNAIGCCWLSRKGFVILFLAVLLAMGSSAFVRMPPRIKVVSPPRKGLSIPAIGRKPQGWHADRRPIAGV